MLSHGHKRGIFDLRVWQRRPRLIVINKDFVPQINNCKDKNTKQTNKLNSWAVAFKTNNAEIFFGTHNKYLIWTVRLFPIRIIVVLDRNAQLNSRIKKTAKENIECPQQEQHMGTVCVWAWGWERPPELWHRMPRAPGLCTAALQGASLRRGYLEPDKSGSAHWN